MPLLGYSIKNSLDEHTKFGRVSYLTTKPPSRNGKGADAFNLVKKDLRNKVIDLAPPRFTLHEIRFTFFLGGT